MSDFDMDSDFHRLAQDSRSTELWLEHGWSLTGWQTGLIIGTIVLVSLLLELAMR